MKPLLLAPKKGGPIFDSAVHRHKHLLFALAFFLLLSAARHISLACIACVDK
jgi:hypothetical protein